MDYFPKLFGITLLIVQCKSECQGRCGPAKFVLENSEECSATGDHEIVFTPKVIRDPDHCSVRKFCYFLNVSLPFGYTNEYEAEDTTLCKDSIGRWQQVELFPRKAACKAYPSFWMGLVQAQRNAEKPCPIPKGNYSLDCGVITDKMLFWVNHTDKGEPMDFYGEYKYVTNYYRKDRLVGCIVEKLTIYPIY